jgi:hypothetical protein
MRPGSSRSSYGRYGEAAGEDRGAGIGGDIEERTQLLLSGCPDSGPCRAAPPATRSSPLPCTVLSGKE